MPLLNSVEHGGSRMDHMGVCFVIDFLVFQNEKRKMDAREARG